MRDSNNSASCVRYSLLLISYYSRNAITNEAYEEGSRTCLKAADDAESII